MSQEPRQLRYHRFYFQAEVTGAFLLLYLHDSQNANLCCSLELLSCLNLSRPLT